MPGRERRPGRGRQQEAVERVGDGGVEIGLRDYGRGQPIGARHLTALRDGTGGAGSYAIAAIARQAGAKLLDSDVVQALRGGEIEDQRPE